MKGERHIVQEVIPVRDVQVRIRIPGGKSVRSVYLAPGRIEVPHTLEDDYVSLAVPSLDIHKMVVVEMGEESPGSQPESKAPEESWFANSWRRLMLEFNVRDEPPYLTRLDASALADAAARAGVAWYWVHGKDNGGTLLHNTRVGHKHSALGSRDFLEEFTQALSARGIRWGFHVNLTKDQWMYRLHPEWRQKWNDGTDRGASDFNPDWDNLCPNSPHREYNLAVIKELAEKFRPEGFWIDRLDWGGVLPERFACACHYCQTKFQRETGYELPLEVEWESPAWREFVRWRAHCLTRYFAEVCDVIKAVDPQITACLSTHNGLDMFGYWFHGQDVEDITEPADHVTQELHAEREGYLAYSLHPRFTRAITGGKPMDGATFRHSGDLDFAYKPQPQLMAEVFTLIANGATAFFQDLLYPDGTIEPYTYTWLKPVFDQIKEREPWLGGGQPVPYVAVYFSKRTRLYYGRNEPGDRYLLSFLGVCKALLETHILFDIVTDRGLNAEDLSRYRALILPNAACLSDQKATEVRQFVASGGGLISTYMSSLLDEDGHPRPDFGLSDVFGAHYLESVGLPLSYVQLRDDAVLGEGLPSGVPLLHRRPQLKVQPTDGAQVDGRIVFGQEGLNRLSSLCHPPMPEASNYPAMLLLTYQDGRSVYFPGQPGAVYARWGHPEFKRLLKNAVAWAANEASPLEVVAPMCVEATLYEHPDQNRLVAHLVNFQPELGRTWDLVRAKFLA